MRKLLVLAWLLGASLLAAPGCGGGSAEKSSEKSKSEAPAPPLKPLYQRLGGLDNIKVLVDDFVGNVAGDGRINARFEHANLPHLKAQLVDQICQASGGPCAYAGKSMADAHRGMAIADKDFDALVDDLKKSLNKLHVGAQEQSELLAALGGMRDQIVKK